MPARSKQDRVNALGDLLTVLEDLPPSVQIAGLRRLAEHAEDLIVVFDAAEELAWALDNLDEVASTLENLQGHRSTLERLCELDHLADDVDELNRALRGARRQRDELEWTVAELEDSTEVDG